MKSTRSRNFEKIYDSRQSPGTYDALWFYTTPYYIEEWMIYNLVELPRWISCSSMIEEQFIHAFSGGGQFTLGQNHGK